jgi:hypothetical protein
MVNCQTKNPNLGKFLEALGMEKVGIFFDHLEYITAIWYILKSGNPNRDLIRFCPTGYSFSMSVQDYPGTPGFGGGYSHYMKMPPLLQAGPTCRTAMPNHQQIYAQGPMV